MSKEAPRRFVDVLQEMDHGKVAADLSDKLTELVAAVKTHGRKGSLSLKIDVDPRKQKQEGFEIEHLEVRVDIVLKAPDASHPASLFFVTAGANLTRRNPRQADLEDVTGPAAVGE